MRSKLRPCVAVPGAFVLAGAFLVAGPAPAPASASTPGLTETGTTTYVIDPDAGEIRVTIDLAIENSRPNYYYYGTEIVVLSQAIDLTATSDAGPVTHTVSETEELLSRLNIIYPPVYTGETRHITVDYTLPASVKTPGDIRAGKAYASLCAVGNGADTGTITVSIPDGYDVNIDAGAQLLLHSESNGRQILSTGAISEPSAFWTCLDAQNPSKYVTTAIVAGGQDFDLAAWPEDPGWTNLVQQYVLDDTPALVNLTGLKMPGGRITIREGGNLAMGEYAGLYDSRTATATIGENVDSSTVAHEISHIWFSRDLFSDIWMEEGFAGYSSIAAGSGNYVPCGDPGRYPGSGSPDLIGWKTVNVNSTSEDLQISDYQYAASCYIVTVLAADMGPDNFRHVLAAAKNGEIAYVGSGPAEKSPNAGPVSAEELLDLIDERGLVPAGIADLNGAQNLLARFGIFTDPSQLRARADAREHYHRVIAEAGTWKLPYAVRAPMASWDFGTAQTAMSTVEQILKLRDQVRRSLPDLSLDGTSLQDSFQTAQSQRDLDDLLVLMRKEASASARVAQAEAMAGQARNVVESIGLMGTDTAGPLARAREDLRRVQPDEANATAGSVIDTLGAAGATGLLRIAAVLGVLLAAIVAATLLALWRRRRGPTVVVVAGQGPPALLVSGPVSNPVESDRSRDVDFPRR